MVDLLLVASLNHHRLRLGRHPDFEEDARQAVKDLELRATQRGAGPIHDPAILPSGRCGVR